MANISLIWQKLSVLPGFYLNLPLPIMFQIIILLLVLVLLVFFGILARHFLFYISFQSLWDLYNGTSLDAVGYFQKKGMQINIENKQTIDQVTLHKTTIANDTIIRYKQNPDFSKTNDRRKMVYSTSSFTALLFVKAGIRSFGFKPAHAFATNTIQLFSNERHCIVIKTERLQTANQYLVTICSRTHYEAAAVSNNLPFIENYSY